MTFSPIFVTITPLPRGKMSQNTISTYLRENRFDIAQHAVVREHTFWEPLFIAVHIILQAPAPTLDAGRWSYITFQNDILAPQLDHLITAMFKNNVSTDPAKIKYIELEPTLREKALSEIEQQIIALSAHLTLQEWVQIDTKKLESISIAVQNCIEMRKTEKIVQALRQMNCSDSPLRTVDPHLLLDHFNHAGIDQQSEEDLEKLSLVLKYLFTIPAAENPTSGIINSGVMENLFAPLFRKHSGPSTSYFYQHYLRCLPTTFFMARHFDTSKKLPEEMATTFQVARKKFLGKPTEPLYDVRCHEDEHGNKKKVEIKRLYHLGGVPTSRAPQDLMTCGWKITEIVKLLNPKGDLKQTKQIVKDLLIASYFDLSLVSDILNEESFHDHIRAAIRSIKKITDRPYLRLVKRRQIPNSAFSNLLDTLRENRIKELEVADQA